MPNHECERNGTEQTHTSIRRLQSIAGREEIATAKEKKCLHRLNQVNSGSMASIQPREER
jgi:hypothetical protein